jgi:SAM-dependent methyltransferase
MAPVPLAPCALTKRKSLLTRIRNRLLPDRKVRRKAAKADARIESFASDVWQRETQFARRSYTSYDAYLEHQASKLDAAYDRRVIKDDDEVAQFTESFRGIEELRGARSVLCLGARLGAEVRALRDLSYFAVGIDLNPGKNNPYVHYGDFHALPFKDATVDAAYTNALDHVFDLERVMSEVHRVLRTGGVFVADVLPGFDEGFLPGKYEATYWRRTDDLLAAIAGRSRFFQISLRVLGTRGRNPWSQAVFRKHGAGETHVAPAVASAVAATGGVS